MPELEPEDWHPALLRALPYAEASAGDSCAMVIARIDGMPVAAHYWTVEDGHRLANPQAERISRTA